MGEALIATAAVGAAGQIVGGLITAEAQSDAAKAEKKQAEADRFLAREVAEPSPEELAQLNQAIELNEKDIARKTELLESADPAIIEAGKQALQLLRGEEAKTIEPLKRNLEEKRENLKERLREQLGSGFATSTAGAQALNDFDAEATGVIAQEQDRSLGRLLGVASNVSSAGLSSNIQAAGSIAGLFGNLQQRRLSAVQGTPLTPFAGADFVGRAKFGQILGGAGSSAVQGATLGAALGRFGGGGGITGGSQTLQLPELGSSAGLGQGRTPGLGGNFKF